MCQVLVLIAEKRRVNPLARTEYGPETLSRASKKWIVLGRKQARRMMQQASGFYPLMAPAVNPFTMAL